MKKQIIYKGEIFESISILAKKLAINTETLRGRIERKWPENEWSLKAGQDNEIEYKGKIYSSKKELAINLGINEKLLTERIRNKWPQSRWNEVGKALISTGYTWEEAPKHLKETSEKLAIGLSISSVEAYKILLEKLFKNKRK